MDWVRPKLLASNILWIVNNQSQFLSTSTKTSWPAASVHSNIFQRQIYRGLMYSPNNSRETRLSKKGEEVGIVLAYCVQNNLAF